MIKRIKVKKSKKWLIIATLILCAYIGSYCILSYLGIYEPMKSGNTRSSALLGLATTDIQNWHPKYAYWQLFRDIDGHMTFYCNTLGFVYAPLVIIDQLFVHKTKPI